MSGPQVRDFAAHDVAAANALTNLFILHTAIHFGDQPATDAGFHALWQAGVARYPWLAAEVDGAFAGYAKAGPWRDRAAYLHTVELGVYVRDPCRGRGVGRELYRVLLDRLRADGFHTAVGGIALPNDASVRLHEGLGFRHVGTFREVGRKFDRWHDVGFWQIDLGA